MNGTTNLISRVLKNKIKYIIQSTNGLSFRSATYCLLSQKYNSELPPIYDRI